MNLFIDPEDSSAKGEIERVFTCCVTYLGQTPDLDIEVSLVSPEEIRRLNRAERGKDEVTDVLSFPALNGIRNVKLEKKNFKLDVDPETGNIMLGSIAICLARAAEQAAEYGHSEEREIAYLAVHGLLHLLGYDHMTDEDKREMRELEEGILGSLSITR